MKHYLKKLEDTVRHHWKQKALCDYEGDAFTYADLATNIEQFRLFLNNAGIKKGKKIAICARNSARWAMTFWSINVNGCVVVPLLADFSPSGISTLTHHSESVLLFVDEDIWTNLNPEGMPTLKAAINIKDGSLLWQQDKTVADAWKNRKGVMLDYGALSDTDDFSNSHFPNRPGETVVSMLPLAHMYGLMIEFIHPNIDGVTIYFLGKTPSPTTLLKAMRDVKPYMVVTVPLVMEKIYASSIKPALEQRKKLLAIPLLKRLIYRAVRKRLIAAFGGQVRCFIMGGAALKPEVEQCFCKMRLPFTVGYGMTEACPLLGFEWWTKFAPGSCGKPVHELRIDSEDPKNIPGEIQARGRNITLGYFKNPEANAAAFTEDGWFRTGDLGIMDEKHNIFIRGRIKSMILSSNGQNIYPEEVEAVLSSCPYVNESVVVERDEKIVALVYPDIPSDIDTETREKLPDIIRIAANKALPVYSKINKVELRDVPFEKTPKMSIKRYLYQ